MRPEITANASYITPAGTPRFLIDRILGDTRIIFLLHYLKLVFKTRADARKGLYDTFQWVKTSHDVFTLVERCGGRIHITGLDNLRNCKSPAVIVSNHMSTLETMIFPGIIQPLKDITFVVKAELARHWAFGDVMRSRDPVTLNRHNPREDFRIVMEQGLERLKKGISIVMFPQSTRRVKFVPAEFHSLGTKLALHAAVPLIPVAIKTDFWEHGRYSKYLGPINRKKTVRIAFGEPIEVKGSGKEEHLQVIRFIDSHLTRWQDDQPEIA